MDNHLVRRLGFAIRDARQGRGMTQGDLARAAGISKRSIVDIELGRASGVALGSIERLLDVLEIPVAVGVADPTPKPLGFREVTEVQKARRQRLAESILAERDARRNAEADSPSVPVLSNEVFDEVMDIFEAPQSEKTRRFLEENRFD